MRKRERQFFTVLVLAWLPAINGDTGGTYARILVHPSAVERGDIGVMWEAGAYCLNALESHHLERGLVLDRSAVQWEIVAQQAFMRRN